MTNPEQGPDSRSILDAIFNTDNTESTPPHPPHTTSEAPSAEHRQPQATNSTQGAPTNGNTPKYTTEINGNMFTTRIGYDITSTTEIPDELVKKLSPDDGMDIAGLSAKLAAEALQALLFSNSTSAVQPSVSAPYWQAMPDQTPNNTYAQPAALSGRTESSSPLYNPDATAEFEVIDADIVLTDDNPPPKASKQSKKSLDDTDVLPVIDESEQQCSRNTFLTPRKVRVLAAVGVIASTTWIGYSVYDAAMDHTGRAPQLSDVGTAFKGAALDKILGNN